METHKNVRLNLVIMTNRGTDSKSLLAVPLYALEMDLTGICSFEAGKTGFVHILERILLEINRRGAIWNGDGR